MWDSLYTDIACYTTAGETGPCGHCDIVKKGDKVEVYGKRLPIYQIPMVISICGKTSYYMRKIGKPDLVIEDISWSPSNPKQGDTITFTVKIKNRGDGNAGTSTVKYYIDGSYVDSDTVPSLSWTAHSGSHSIKAIADCYGAIAESNEGNNEKSITIEVGEEPEEIKFIGTITGQNWPMGFGAYYFKVDKMLEGPIPVGDDIRVMVYMSAYPNPLNNYDRLKKGDKAEVYAEFEEELGKRYDSWVDREVWAADITGDEKYYVKNIEEKREIILPVPYYDQDRTNWCELATLSMVLKYYGYSLHPEALAEIFGVDHDNFLNFWNIERILLFLQESRKIPESLGLKTKGIAFEKEEIKNSVDKGYPIFLGMPFPINHAVVIVGYEEGNNPGDPILFINDPSGHFTNTICGNKKDPEIVVPIKFSNVKKNLPWLSQVFSVQGEPTPPSGTIYLYDGAIFVGKPKPGAPKGITTPVCHLWLDRGISWKYQNGEIKHNLKLENSNVFNIGCTICNHKKTDSNYDLFLYIRDASGKIVYEDVNTYPKEPILVKGERTQIVKFPIFDLNKFPAGSYELGISLFKIIGPGHEEFCDSIGTIPFTIEESAKPLEKIWITGPDEIKAGETLQWQAYGSYSDGTQKELTNQVSWTADPSDILQNMDNGKFKGLKGGEATLKIDYEGKSASKKVTVIEKENQPPKASFTYEKDGLTVRFTSTGYDPDGDIETYSWFFGDGDTSNQKNPTHRYSSEGTYTVVLLVRDDKGLPGSCSEDITITEKPKEKPDLIIQDISWEPKNPETGDPVDFTITIKNIGTKDVNKPIYVDFKFCGNYFPRKKIEGLKAGESANVIYKGIGAGTCEAIATVDPYNAIPESDETNNSMCLAPSTTISSFPLQQPSKIRLKPKNYYIMRTISYLEKDGQRRDYQTTQT